MNLKQKLAALRSQSGQTPPQPPSPADRPPIDQLLHSAAPEETLALANRDEAVAHLLQGECVVDGMIVVDHHIPISDRYGKHVLSSSPWINPPGIGQSFHVKHAVFMDTETTGLAGGTGTLALLLGLACIEDETLHLRQLFLAEFGCETALVQTAADWIGTRKHLVTFNGKSFDTPLMATRYRLARLPDPFAGMNHVDLFHPTRRAFANRWPDCRLQTAEKRLLGAGLCPCGRFAVLRHSGRLVGLHASRVHRLADILTHNRFDLLSLVMSITLSRRGV